MAAGMTVLEENHTDYAACYQRIKWNVEVIAGYERPNGFIVQHFFRTSSPKDFILDDTSYYEAWEVKDGFCIDTKGQFYDDEFAIGHPMDQLEVFPKSTYTAGEYCFTGKVFWVDESKHSSLFQVVRKWPRNEVKQAGGLHSVYQSDEFADKRPDYKRTPFIYRWNMLNDEVVYGAYGRNERAA